jgi:hypothetical protein
MLPTQVALVPFEDEDADFHKQLLLVASALQTQVVRDFGPIWGVSGVVAPFMTLEEVPPQYFPIVIFGRPLPQGHHGFHLAIDGRPFGLIHKDDGWSLTASHELLELLGDPSGSRTVPGPSLKDAYDEALGEGTDQVGGAQGTVDYLVEVCDPCEESTYEIDGVVVSDFVTPSYYDPFDARGRSYSFTGEVTRPRQLLDGGYLSWRTRPPQASIWQAFAQRPASSVDEAPSVQGTPIDHLTIRPLRGARSSPAGDDAAGDGGSRPRLSRDRIDSEAKWDRAAGSAQAFMPDPSWNAFEDAFRKDILTLVGLLDQPKPPPSIRDIIRLLEEVGPGGVPTPARLDELNLPPVPEVAAGDTYEVILNALREQEKIVGLFGPDLSDPGLASWLLRLEP